VLEAVLQLAAQRHLEPQLVLTTSRDLAVDLQLEGAPQLLLAAAGQLGVTAWSGAGQQREHARPDRDDHRGFQQSRIVGEDQCGGRGDRQRGAADEVNTAPDGPFLWTVAGVEYAPSTVTT